MALFSKPDQQTNQTPNATIISASTQINGQINARKALHIDGKHEGTIDSEGHVTIGAAGTVEGEIAADKLVITGSFHGTADCENVEVLAGGNVRGKVIANNLTIDHDCNFEGESIRKAKAAAKPAQKPKLPIGKK